ncbi:MAG TPA: hypothetical protein VIQ02_03395 [Jiangellaceae bacterium]
MPLSARVAPNASAELTQKYAAARKGGRRGAWGLKTAVHLEMHAIVAKQFREPRGMVIAEVVEVEAFGIDG